MGDLLPISVVRYRRSDDSAVREKRRRERGESAKQELPGKVVSPQVTFVEAQVQEPCEAALLSALEVQTEGGGKRMIRSQGEVAWAAELIRSLNKSGAC